MIVKRLNIASIPQAIQSMGTDTMGQKIMSKKAQILAFEIRNLSFEAANILKQEALSVGGECATPRGTITHKGEHIALLFGTQAQFAKLLPKLALQPFGLKSLKKTLESHLRPFHHTPEIMAIVNVTPDSFYAASRQSPQSAIHRICSLLEKDITYIDVGAASSRPGSELLDSQEEIARLKPVVEYIVSHHLYDKKCFSIDTYNPKTADYALCNGFSIINDVSGFSHNDMAKICAKHKARAILMHTKGTPKIMQNLTHTYTHLFDEIDRFFIDKIATFKDAGVEDIVLDIGFGFAKNKEQNLALIKHLSHFLHFGLPLLVGARRKNTIGEITGKEAEERLSGTLALHLYALQNGASILRAHDEDAHIDMLKIHKAMQ